MAGLKDLNEYEKRFYDVMKARGYKHSIITELYSYEAKGVRLTHPGGTFRFIVEGFTFSVQIPKTESRAWGVNKKDIVKWYAVHNMFTADEYKAFKANLIVPDLEDASWLTRIDTITKANNEEKSMRDVRQARRMALREAAPAMWRALNLITSDTVDRELLEDADPKALSQCLEALAEAGDQDPDDLSVARSGVVGY